GSPNEKRWQDVTRILDANINVWTTLNVQHLESLNDAVFQITGVRVRETVPDWFVDSADEIYFVDVATRALINRLLRGVVYTPEKAQEALKNFFREGNLNALRELALRQTADAVEHTLQGKAPTAVPPPTGDVVMVCLTERPSAAALVRRGKRVADRLQAECYVVYVVHDEDWTDVPPEAKRKVKEHLALSEGLHMKTQVLVGRDIADTICDFALKNGVTQVFLGRSIHTGLKEFLSRNVIERVIRKIDNLDIHVVADR
ncbi:MAG TPA: universal stress protein, partial [Candidatus Xenobia bacterium]